MSPITFSPRTLFIRFPRRFTISFFLPSLPAPILRTTISHYNRLAPFEVGHVSILYSIKLASIPASNNEKRPRSPRYRPLSFGLSYALMRLRRSAPRRSRRVPEPDRRKAYSRKALHVFSRPTNFSFSFLQLRSLFDLFLARRYPRKGYFELVSKHGDFLFVSSSRF